MYPPTRIYKRRTGSELGVVRLADETSGDELKQTNW
jgi:hypothetical protein